MIDVGLDEAGIARFIEALNGDHHVKIAIHLLDRNENYLQPLSDSLWDGQVTIGANNDVSRSCNLTLLDPYHAIQLDREDAGVGSLYNDRMFAISYCVWQPHWTRSIDVPIFRGPITNVDRDGAFLNCEGMGKEWLAKGVLWTPRSYSVNYNKVSYIADLMRNGVGEKSFALDYSAAKTGAKISLGREVVPWTDATAMASSMGMRLFYDGRGVLRLRNDPDNVLYTFRDGLGGALRGKPKIRYDISNTKNGVWVKGSTTANEAFVWAPADHPLNPERLGRVNDQGKLVPFYDPYIIEDSEITSGTAARTRANKALPDILDQNLQFSADVTVNPLLEEGDMIAGAVEGEYNIPFRIRDMVIPLNISSVGTIGNNKNVRLKTRG